CSRLEAAGESVSLEDVTGLGGGPLDAPGPVVDDGLLATAYGGDSARDVQSRSLIEGCLVDAKGTVLARASMSLMQAWDLLTPGRAAEGSVRLHGVQAYARACEAELGELPMFRDGAPL